MARFDRSESLGSALLGMGKRITRLETFVQNTLLANPISGARLADDSLGASLFKRGVQPYVSNIWFTPGAYSSGWPVSWGLSAIRFANGTEASINAGSTTISDAGTVRYLYWLSGSADLQVMANFDDVNGDDRALVAILIAPPESDNPESQRAMVQPVVGLGAAIHSGILNANSVIASHIQAGSVTTDHLQAGAVTAGKINVADLSAISVDLGVVTAGFIIGLIIESSNGDSRVQMDPNGIRGYDNSVQQWEARNSDGRIYAGGGTVILDQAGITIQGGDSGTAFLKFKDSGGTLRSAMWATSFGVGIYGAIEMLGEIYPNTAGGFDLGDSSYYWGEVHCTDVVDHTPALPPGTDALAVLQQVRRTPTGNLDKRNLPELLLVRPDRDRIRAQIHGRKVGAVTVTDEELAKAAAGLGPDADLYRLKETLARQKMDQVVVDESEVDAVMAREDVLGVSTGKLLLLLVEAVNALIVNAVIRKGGAL